VTQPSVLIGEINGVGWIKLNRPKVINSLNVEMVKLIYQQLQQWKDDKEVYLVCISGEGKKGLCAGGDMRTLYDLKESNVKEVAFDFFSTEYQMNITIHRYPKPVLVYMDGIVMGGGVGISIGGTHRIVTENTKWSMPEMNIGFYPDVGASYFLNKMPGCIGRYLALTSEIINASDAIYAGVADFYIDSKNWGELEYEILRKTWSSKSVQSELSKLIKKFSKPVNPELSYLAEVEEKINKHFAFDSLEEILSSLKNATNNGDKWAEKTIRTLLSKSPISLKVTLHQLKEGKTKSLVDCFKMELALSMNFMDNPDFYEGVRSVLVDKDRSPNWKYHRIEDISEESILNFFKWNEEYDVFTTFDRLDNEMKTSNLNYSC
jgi:enoyl-CoA hydratase